MADSSFAKKSGIKPHSHEYYHLFFVRSGPAGFTVEDDAFRLEDGEFMIAKPGEMHSVEDVRVRMASFYEVKFTTSSPALEKQLRMLPARFPRDELAAGLIRELVVESERGEQSSPGFATGYLLSLVNYLYRQYGTHEPVDTAIIDTTGYSQVSKDIVQYLEAHYENEVPLQNVADALGLNKNYICSAFKRDSGMTIGYCLMLVRIRKAAELISFSDMNLSMVAAATGFTNLSHFNRIFKKVVGIPPGQYRRSFTADILVHGDGVIKDEFIARNGFIVSVLGNKKLSAADVLAESGYVDDEEEGK